MTPILIQAGNQEYEALVGSQLLEEIGSLVAQKLRGPRCAIVSDENVAALFAQTVVRSLTSAGFQPALIPFPPAKDPSR